MDLMFTTADAARAFDLSAAAIRGLHHRGQLTRYGGPRSAMWDAAELARVKVTRHADTPLDSVTCSNARVSTVPAVGMHPGSSWQSVNTPDAA